MQGVNGVYPTFNVSDNLVAVMCLGVLHVYC